MTGRLRSRRIVLSAAFAALAAGAGCTPEPGPGDTNTFYCTNSESVIVDDRNCDNDHDASAHFFLVYGIHHANLAVGQQLTHGWRFPANDIAARRSWTLPPTGRIINGTVKTGVIGTTGTSVSSGS